MNTGCAEGEGAATHSTEAEGNAPSQFLDYEYGVGNQGVEDSMNTCGAEGEGGATHSAEAEGNLPNSTLLPMNTLIVAGAAVQHRTKKVIVIARMMRMVTSSLQL